MAPTYPEYGPPRSRTNDPYPYPPLSTQSSNSLSTYTAKVSENDPPMSRTPSPTPSELKELNSGILDWKAFLNWRFWFRKEWAWYYPLFTLLIVLTALITIYHTQIVNWLTPFAHWLHQLSVGWLVPIGILFVISFPPLFGHEIIAVLCGLVWGLWIGFAIVAAGTYLGEVGNFYAFKYCCRARGEKLEKTSIFYACLARVVREGGFKIALIARLSAIPGHFTTAVFSTCGMGIITFSIAAILSLPKQFVTVYLGVILKEADGGQSTTQSKLISDVVLAITIVITVAAMWFIFHKIKLVKPDVIYARRKARQAKLARAEFSPYDNGDAITSQTAFNPRASESDIPLTASAQQYQQWDKEGRAIGYSGDPRLNVYAPQPIRSNTRFGNNDGDIASRIPTFRTEGGGGYDSHGVRYPRDAEESGADYDYRARGTHQARQSSDDVEWDMQAIPTSQAGRDQYNSVAAGPPGIEPQRGSFESDETVHQPGYVSPPAAPLTQVAPSPRAQPHEGRSYTLQDVGPTPAGQSWRPQREMTASPTELHSPFDDPSDRAQSPEAELYYTGHGQEATDSSYQTAVSSGHSRETTEEAPSAPRTFSPPPPNYRTNLR